MGGAHLTGKVGRSKTAYMKTWLFGEYVPKSLSQFNCSRIITITGASQKRNTKHNFISLLTQVIKIDHESNKSGTRNLERKHNPLNLTVNICI